MRIGRFSVPPIRLHPVLVDSLRTLYEKYGGRRIEDLDELATVLGHSSSRSGTFMLKLAAMRSFGLVEGRGAVMITDIGSKIANPLSREEEANALRRALDSVPLWREIYQRFGIDLPNDFADHLAAIAGCTADEAAEKAEWLKKAYLVDTKLLRTFRQTPKEVSSETVRPSVATPGIIEVKLGDIHILLPANRKDIEIARSLLDLLERRLQSK